jgi:predicted ATPase
MPKPVYSHNLIHHLTPRNFLSFGPENVGIDLNPLNVLIGPNGSGKSNLIEAIDFLRSSVKEWREVLRKGGGVTEWVWKGNAEAVAMVEWIIQKPTRGIMPLRHRIAFQPQGQTFSLVQELVENELTGEGQERPDFYYRYENGRPFARKSGSSAPIVLAMDSLELDRSIVAQRNDPEFYPAIAWLHSRYSKIRIYREWSMGRNSPLRQPQRADMRNDFLEEDFSNLGLFLSRLGKTPKAKQAIIDNLKNLYDGVTGFDVVVEGGTVQVFFTEGDFVIPASRLSDGTLRFLCLLAILCDPTPPLLVCIEEPEIGLHPDILPTVADLLKSASERMQLIVTTHSDIIVDAMTDMPESVVICEKHEGQTEMTRLLAEEMKVWLEKYRLGQLWIQGQLGGKRW